MVLLLEMFAKRKGEVRGFSPIQPPKDLFIGYNCTVALFLFLFLKNFIYLFF